MGIRNLFLASTAFWYPPRGYFALSGLLFQPVHYPGRCPGLFYVALSGRLLAGVLLLSEYSIVNHMS